MPAFNNSTQPASAAHRFKAHGCEQIEEYAWLSRQDQLRADVLARHATPAAQLAEAAALVELHVLSRVHRSSASGRFVAALGRDGVDRNTVAHALAQAWLLQHEQFEVPRRGWADVLRESWALLAVSLTVALACLIVTALWLWRVNPQLEMYFLVLPPLMGVVGYALTSVLYTLLRRLVQRPPGK